MLVIKNYVRAQSLQEAYDLCQDRNNIIIGGMLWLKMQNRSVDTAIDLCDLNLNHIEETEEEYRIGAMVTLCDLECHSSLNEYTHHAMKESVKNIVGVQFRNLATVGGSLFGRYGFSDVLTIFMALDAYVELYKGGMIPIREFAAMPLTKDLLVRVIVKKTPLQVAYISQRNTKTDFPVLTCAASYINGEYSCVIGARPLKAIAFVDENHFLNDGVNEENIKKFADVVSGEIKLGSNLRGSAEYRQRLVKVLMKRAFLALEGGKPHGN